MAQEYSWEKRLGITPWEPRDMTICIAGICDRRDTIVLAADRELGIGFTSGEFQAGKFHFLYKDWFGAISGDAIAAVEVLKDAHRNAPSTLETYEVRKAVENSYRRVRLDKAEAKYLGSRGWKLDDFIQKGAELLPATTYASIDIQISQYDLGADLLVAGFEKDGDAGIFTVKNPGVSSDQSQLGFWCIGSGATAAQMTLFERCPTFGTPAEELALYIYEAKTNAERATGVGPMTDLYLVRKGHGPIRLQEPTLAAMKGMRDRLRPTKFQPEDIKALSQLDEFQIIRKLAGQSAGS